MEGVCLRVGGCGYVLGWGGGGGLGEEGCSQHQHLSWSSYVYDYYNTFAHIIFVQFYLF